MTDHHTRSPTSTVNRPADERATLERDEHRLRRRLIGAVIVTAAIISLVLAVPSLRHIASTIKHMSPGWIALAIGLELASDASFVVIFRLFFDRVPAPVARELAWTEEASGALLPGGGVGAYAVGGWLLHRAGISTRRILKRSSGLFFLTSATNVAAMAGAGVLLAAGVGRSPGGFLRAVVPIIAAVTATAVVLALPILVSTRRITAGWVRDLICGVPVAERALAGGSWRLSGAIGYLGFDIAVLGVTMAATGHPLPVPALVLAYIVGYLANLIPIPGGIGVLEGGLAGCLSSTVRQPPRRPRRCSSITRSRSGSPASAVSRPTGGCAAGCAARIPARRDRIPPKRRCSRLDSSCLSRAASGDGRELVGRAQQNARHESGRRSGGAQKETGFHVLRARGRMHGVSLGGRRRTGRRGVRCLTADPEVRSCAQRLPQTRRHFGHPGCAGAGSQ